MNEILKVSDITYQDIANYLHIGSPTNVEEYELPKEEIKLLNNPKEIFKEKLIYEDDLLDGYIFIRKLFLSAKKERGRTR